MAADGAVRAFAVTSKETVEYARACHNTSPVVSAALGRLLTGALMMGSMMKGEKDLLTLKIQGDGPCGMILATADSAGHVKGWAENPHVLIHANSKGKLDVSGAVGKGMLQVIRDLGLKEPYVGSCELVSGEIAEDLTYYFASSEQVPSGVGLGVLMNHDNTVRQAGGFIIQLMPFTSEEVVAELEKKLSSAKPVTTMLDEGMTPEDILENLLSGLGLEITDRMPVSYRCDCSRERFSRGLISLGRKELQSMIDEGQAVRIDCQFCKKSYEFTPAEMKELLKNARAD